MATCGDAANRHTQVDLEGVRLTQVHGGKYELDINAKIARRLRPGQLALLESTTYPGTTRELRQSTLEETSGLAAGERFPRLDDKGGSDQS